MIDMHNGPQAANSEITAMVAGTLVVQVGLSQNRDHDVSDARSSYTRGAERAVAQVGLYEDRP